MYKYINNNKLYYLQVHGYYRKCNGGALCNCGAAVRSGNSAFIANFCKVNGHENRYVTRKICDKKEMVVEETSNSYKVSFSDTCITHFCLTAFIIPCHIGIGNT